MNRKSAGLYGATPLRCRHGWYMTYGDRSENYRFGVQNITRESSVYYGPYLSTEFIFFIPKPYDPQWDFRRLNKWRIT